MTVRAFVGAGYATMVDELQRSGKDILTATDEANRAFGLPVASDEEPVPAAADNAAALRELEAQMRGVKA